MHINSLPFVILNDSHHVGPITRRFLNGSTPSLVDARDRRPPPPLHQPTGDGDPRSPHSLPLTSCFISAMTKASFSLPSLLPRPRVGLRVGRWGEFSLLPFLPVHLNVLRGIRGPIQTQCPRPLHHRSPSTTASSEQCPLTFQATHNCPRPPTSSSSSCLPYPPSCLSQLLPTGLPSLLPTSPQRLTLRSP